MFCCGETWGSGDGGGLCNIEVPCDVVRKREVLGTHM